MLDRRSNIEDLSEIVDKEVVARHLAEPLVSFDCNADPSVVNQFMKNHGYDLVGVRVDGLVAGKVKRERLGGSALQDILEQFEDAEVVSAGTPLRELIRALEEQPAVFVAAYSHVDGLVTRADLQKTPVRLWLFGVVSLLEMELLRVIRNAFPNDTWRERLSESRLGAAESLFENRRKRNEEIGLVDCLEFADKKTIVASQGNVREKLGFKSRKECEGFLRKVQTMRDELAHGQNVAPEGWSVVRELADRTEILIAALERISDDELAGIAPEK